MKPRSKAAKYVLYRKNYAIETAKQLCDEIDPLIKAYKRCLETGAFPLWAADLRDKILALDMLAAQTAFAEAIGNHKG